MLLMIMFMKFVYLWKTNKSKYFEKEMQFLTLIKEFINCTYGAILWQKINFSLT